MVELQASIRQRVERGLTLLGRPRPYVLDQACRLAMDGLPRHSSFMIACHAGWTIRNADTAGDRQCGIPHDQPAGKLRGELMG